MNRCDEFTKECCRHALDFTTFFRCGVETLIREAHKSTNSKDGGGVEEGLNKARRLRRRGERQVEPCDIHVDG